jgi:hypothetical protein
MSEQYSPSIYSGSEDEDTKLIYNNINKTHSSFKDCIQQLNTEIYITKMKIKAIITLSKRIYHQLAFLQQVQNIYICKKREIQRQWLRRWGVSSVKIDDIITT